MISARFDLARACAFLGEWAEMSRLLTIPETHSTDHLLSKTVRARYSLWGAPLPELDTLLPDGIPESYFTATTRSFIEVQQTRFFSEESRAWWLDSANGAATARRRSLMYQCITEICFYIQNEEGGFDALERAVESGLSDLVWIEMCPLFEGYKHTPRYQTIRQSLTHSIARVRA